MVRLGAGISPAVRGLGREPGLVVLCAGDRDRGNGGEAVGGRHLRRRGGGDERDPGGQLGRDGRSQVGMADQHAGAAVLQDVGDFLGLEVPVDGHGVRAERLRGVGHFHEGEVVAHEDGDALPRRHTERRQPRRRAPHAFVECRAGDAHARR